MLYIANAAVQLVLLDTFLGGSYHFYGIQAIRDLATGQEWAGLLRFPRLTLCDFEIFQMGNTHRHTVQCVLPINFFADKIYLFLWYWLVFVGLASVFSFLRWLWTIVFEHSRTRYVRKQLKIMDRIRSGSDRDRKMSYRFSEKYLRQDGIFVLKLVAKNSTDLVVADIVAALWDNYRVKPENTPGGVDLNDREIMDQIENNADMIA